MLVSETDQALQVAPPDAIGTVDISIVIPTRNRSDRLKRTLEACQALMPAAREIIVVDDHSDPDCAGALRDLENGTVKYIRLASNEGQAVARSIGFATARGRYLVSLDDDSWFLEPDALRRIWHRLEGLPNCGILALRGFSPVDPVQPPRPRLTLVADHITCGAAYRAQVLHQTGYHLDFLDYEGEETDLSVKVIDAGFDIVLDESIRFFHDYDPSRRSARTLSEVRRLAVRNDLLRSWIYLPLDIAMAVTAWRGVSHLVWGLRRAAILPTLRGYLGFLRLLPRAAARRCPIRREAALRYLSLRRRPHVMQDV